MSVHKANSHWYYYHCILEGKKLPKYCSYTFDFFFSFFHFHFITHPFKIACHPISLYTSLFTRQFYCTIKCVLTHLFPPSLTPTWSPSLCYSHSVYPIPMTVCKLRSLVLQNTEEWLNTNGGKVFFMFNQVKHVLCMR